MMPVLWNDKLFHYGDLITRQPVSVSVSVSVSVRARPHIPGALTPRAVRGLLRWPRRWVPYPRTVRRVLGRPREDLTSLYSGQHLPAPHILPFLPVSGRILKNAL
jgi:hypothetical protein